MPLRKTARRKMGGCNICTASTQDGGGHSSAAEFLSTKVHAARANSESRPR